MISLGGCDRKLCHKPGLPSWLSANRIRRNVRVSYELPATLISLVGDGVKLLVTGSAGFIGASVCWRLLEGGAAVIGVDNFCDYYDVSLKHARNARNREFASFIDVPADISDREAMQAVFVEHQPECVINLAAQVGYRESITNPQASIDTNLVGFANILEGCRQHNVRHLVYASSSSVYGGNTDLPFGEMDRVDRPLSLYAATKKANELMAHAYSNLYGLPTTGLRFFTVYGPWGRPDMALSVFARKILNGEPIDVFDHGRHRRDFTYIDDIVTGVIKVLDAPPQTDVSQQESAQPNGKQHIPYRVLNIGARTPVELMTYIELLEENLGKQAIKRMLPRQRGDMPETFADVEELVQLTGYCPEIDVATGIANFAEWYLTYYGN